MSKPTFDSSIGNSRSTAGTTLSWNHSCSGNNRGLFVFLWINNTHSSAAVTYNGVAMTQVGSVAVGVRTLYAFFLANPASGVNSVSCSWVTSRLAIGLSYSFSTVLQTGAVGTPVSTSGNTESSTSLNATLDADQIFVDCVASFRNSSTTPPGLSVSGSNVAGAAESNNDGTNSYAAQGSRNNGLGAVTSSWTLTNQASFLHIGVPLMGIPDGGFFAVL